MGEPSEKTNTKSINWLETPHIVNKDNLKLFCRYWEPASNPRALVFICHGLGEHCQWYDHLGSECASQDLLAFSHDHVGHGLSEGCRAHFDKFSLLTQDVIQHVQMMNKQHPGIPCFIVGHSMGGLIAARIIQANPELFKGAVLIGAALKPNPETATPFKMAMAKLVAKVAPKFGIAPIDPSWLTHDEALNKRYAEDPLVYHGGLRARVCVCLLETMEAFAKDVKEIRIPIMAIHGKEDKICEVHGSQFLHDNISSTDKTLQILEGQYHQVHGEANGVGEKCRKDLIKWLVDRIES